MVVCAMQSFATEQQLSGCSAMKSPTTTTLLKNAENVDNGSGNGNGDDGEEDREEGEIVDEFEMIISSEDEEFKLRARIQQLEDKSKDIEKMDMLSANLANQYNYQRPQAIDRYISAQYQHFSPISVLSDVSSVSAEEFEPPKKYRKHKMKRSEAKRHGQQVRRSRSSGHSQQQSQSQSHLRKKRRHEHNQHNNYNYNYNSNHSQKQPHAAILLDSLDSVTEDETGEYDINVENENDNDHEDDDLDLERLKLSRNKLRVALARAGNCDIKPKHSLKERLQYRMPKFPSPSRSQSPIPSPYLSPSPPRVAEQEEDLVEEVQMPAHSFEGYSQHRSEEDQEEEVVVESTLESALDAPEEPAELKLRLIALKSAILKKHMARKKRDAERAYSPTDMINRVHQPTMNNACVDIDDLMEISPAASPDRTAYSPPPSSHFEEPVDMDLAQTDSEEDNRPVWPQNWHSAVNSGGSWRCYLHNQLPPVPMPIVVDDEDEEEQLVLQQRRQLVDTDDEVPPPPPSFHIPHMQLQLEDDDARDALHLNEQHSQHSQTATCLSDIQSISMDNSQTQTLNSRPFPTESSDDEATALRALLLAKLKPAEKQAPMHALAAIQEQAHDSDDDAEELRLLLLSSIASKRKNSQDEAPGDSPEILKLAVRRFQTSATDEAQLDVALELEQQMPPLPVPAPVPPPVPASVPLPVPPPELPLPLSLPLPVEAKLADTPSPCLTPTPTTTPTPTPTITPTITPTPTRTTTPIPTPNTNIIKIVKPNKVINKKTSTKRKISVQAEAAPPIKRPTTLLLKESLAPLHGHNSTSSTRLITKLDPSTIKVNRLVITLAESSAGSEDELELRSCFAYSSYASYADNASPLSQALDSASNSTTRSNTPNSEIIDSTAPSIPNLRRTVINEYFEKKLDDFLKQARSKVPTVSALVSSKPTPEANKSSSEEPPKAAIESASIAQKAKPTPVAVRHLPVASQREYLRLIERMQLLEKKKIGNVKPTSSSQTVKLKTAIRAAVAIEAAASNKMIKKPTVRAGSNGIRHVTTTATTTKAVEKGISEMPSTSVAAASKSTSPESKTAASKSMSKLTSPASTATQPTKESRLKAFETSFHKIGGSMITNLDKSLHMVEEAKKSKIARLRYSKRLKDLHDEMLEIKQSVKLEEAKLARIQPDIQASHEIIISLKQKRNKLRNAAMDLGHGLNGADYRLLDPTKSEITRKSTLLTKEIRFYNSLVKYEDIPLPANEQSSCSPAPQKATVPEPTVVAEQQSNVNCIESQAENKSLEVRAAIETQLEDVDLSPRIVAAMSAPSYNVSFMRELCDASFKDMLLDEYRTPLSRNYNSQLNVNATICPFELMGRCEDADCSYMHLMRKKTATVAVAAAINVTANAH